MATPRIPGLEVDELSPTMRSARPIPGVEVTEFHAQPNSAGLRNPNVAPGAPSAEAQAFRASQQAGAMRAPPSVPGQPTTSLSGLRSMTGAAGNTVRGVLNNSKVSGMLKAGGAVAAAQAIGDSMQDDSTARYAKRFGVSEPTGDGSIGDIAKFAALRAGGFASDLGNHLTGGLAGKLFRDNPGESSIAPMSFAAPAAGTADLRAPVYPSNTPPGSGPQVTNDLPAGWQARALDTASDNSVRRVTTPDGRTLYTNVAGPDNAALMGVRGGAVSIAPGVPTASSVSPTPATEPMVAGGGAASLSGSVPSQVRSAQTFRDQVAQGNAQRAVTDGLRSGNARERAAAMQLAGQLSGDIENTARASARNEVEQGMNETNNATAQRGQDTQRAIAEGNNAVSLRGQDVQAGIARIQGRMAQMKDDRQYQLDVAKFGEERARTMFGQRQDARNNFNEWAKSAFVTRDKDGKAIPDEAKVADFNTAVNATLGNMITRLQQAGDAASVQKAERLQQLGIAALDEQDKQTLKQLFDRRNRVTEARGLIPGTATANRSDDLFDYAITGADAGLVQKRFKMAGGGSIGVNDLRYADGPANYVLPDLFKAPTSTLGPTLEEQAALKGLR